MRLLTLSGVSAADGSGAVSLSRTFPLGTALASGRHPRQGEQSHSNLEEERPPELLRKLVLDTIDCHGHHYERRSDLDHSVCPPAGKYQLTLHPAAYATGSIISPLRCWR